MTATADDRLLSPNAVAERCGLSVKTVYRAIERGELAASRLGASIRVRTADVEDWIETRRIRPRQVDLRIPVRPAPASGGLRALLPQPTPRGR